MCLSRYITGGKLVRHQKGILWHPVASTGAFFHHQYHLTVGCHIWAGPEPTDYHYWNATTFPEKWYLFIYSYVMCYQIARWAEAEASDRSSFHHAVLGLESLEQRSLPKSLSHWATMPLFSVTVDYYNLFYVELPLQMVWKLHLVDIRLFVQTGFYTKQITPKQKCQCL